MTHVLHLTTWHPVIDGASGAFVLEQCAALRAAGIQVGLVFSRIEGLRGLTRDRLWRGRPGFVRFHQPVPTLGFKSWSIPGFNGAVRRVNARMLQNRFAAYTQAYGLPDILHAHVALDAGRAARRIAAETGLEYVVTEHSSEILNGIRSPKARREAAAVYTDARCVLAVSNALADRIVDIAPDAEVKVVGNLVREGVFALRRPPDDASDQIVVVSIGSLLPDKRTKDAIAALTGLPQTLRDRIEHRIIGTGPERDMLMLQASRGGVRTIFYGNLRHEQAMALLAEAKLFIHPSAYETFGVVLAEAMALGVPIVATRCGGPESIVTADTGSLVAVGDVDALQAAVQNILLNDTKWKARSGAIAQHARKHFHEANVVSAIMEAYG